MRRAAQLLSIVITLMYPLAVYIGLQYFPPRYLVIILLILVFFRFLTTGNSPLSRSYWLLLVFFLAAWTWFTESSLGLKFYPVVVNFGMFVFFAWSLVFPPPVIERLARISTPDLPQKAIRYTRVVTIVWSVFFVVNGIIAWLTVFADDAIWALYNGLIAYIAIGTLFTTEFLVRKLVMKASND